MPGRRGVVAVAVTDPASHEERLAAAGRPKDAHVLIWNFRWTARAGPYSDRAAQAEALHLVRPPGTSTCIRQARRDLSLATLPPPRRPTRDPIHPECVLESPYEVFCFQINPINPNIIAGGCLNGQVGGTGRRMGPSLAAASKAPCDGCMCCDMQPGNACQTQLRAIHLIYKRQQASQPPTARN
jgi:hypothetical protein